MTPDPIREALSDEPHTRWEYCSPRDADERRWVIIFDDADRPPIVITDEKAARTAFARLEMSWNCHLMETAKRAALARPVDPIAWLLRNDEEGVIDVSLHRSAIDRLAREHTGAEVVALGEIDAVARPVDRGAAMADGWKLVPVEPIDDMEAAAENDYEDTGATFPDWKSAYRAMVAAAPQLPSVDQGATIAALEDALRQIGNFAHDRSTGPAVTDALWEIRAMAYAAFTAPQPSGETEC